MVFAQLAEHKRGAHVRKVEELLRSVAHFLEEPFSCLNAQNEKAECQLKAQPPEHGLQANGAAAGGEYVGEAQDRGNAEHSCESSHMSPLRPSREPTAHGQTRPHRNKR